MTRRPWLALAVSLVLIPQLSAQTKQLSWQPLWPEAAPGAKGKEPGDVPAILVSLAPSEKANGAAIVVCPGGGYGGLAMDHEGHQIAQWLNNHGIAAVILKYRHGPRYNHPTPLTDAQRAWEQEVARVEPENLPRHLAGLGFSLISINRAAYADEGQRWREVLTAGGATFVAESWEYLVLDLRPVGGPR